LIGIIFCSFYYDALTFSANFDLSLVFFTFLSESFDVLTAPFVCKYQGFVSAVSIMRDFVPAIYDTTVVIPKESPAPTMLRILKGQSSVVSTSTFNSCGPELLRCHQILAWNLQLATFLKLIIVTDPHFLYCRFMSA